MHTYHKFKIEVMIDAILFKLVVNHKGFDLFSTLKLDLHAYNQSCLNVFPFKLFSIWYPNVVIIVFLVISGFVSYFNTSDVVS